MEADEFHQLQLEQQEYEAMMAELAESRENEDESVPVD